MNTYNEWHNSHVQEDDTSAPWHRFVKNELKREDIEGKTVLEIGCGRGGFSNYLANLNPSPQKIIASDFSLAAIQIARNKYRDQSSIIDWQQQNIMALDFGSEIFDTIISCETIEHISNPKKGLEELYRVLKPGGKLILTCPNYFSLFGIWCLYRWMIGKPFTEGGQPYVNYILSPRVYRWIQSIGFKIVYFKTSEIIIPARRPKHFWYEETPLLLRPFGYRTYYILEKGKRR